MDYTSLSFSDEPIHPLPGFVPLRAPDFGLRVLASLPANVFVYEIATGKPIFYNRALSEALGYPEGVIEGHRDGLTNLMHPDDQKAMIPIEEFPSAEPLELRCRMRHADGSWRWFGARLAVFEADASGRPQLVVGLTVEITALKLREEELERQAGNDALTGLANRRQFLEDLEAQVGAGNLPFTVVCCDIDKFKEINDGHGHAAGDEALRALAEDLRRGVRVQDAVGRLGGDEFSLILRNTSLAQCRSIVDRIRIEFSRRRFGTDSSNFSVSASFGMAEFRPGLSAAEILAAADAKLYEAKRSGRNLVCC